MQERQSLQYEINLSSFRDEAIHKRMILEKCQHELMSKQKHKNRYHKNLGWEIQICRKNIEQIEMIFADSHKFFIDLNLDFVYQMFSAAFKIMIQSYKALSQKLISLIQQKSKAETPIKQTNKEQQKYKFICENFENEPHFLDNLIFFIESEEKKLQKKRKAAEQQLLFEKQCFESIQASDAVNQLGILSRQLDKIIMSSERLGEDQAIVNSESFFDKVRFLTPPEQIQNQFCEKISKSTKNKFVDSMQKISKAFLQKIHQEQRATILEELMQKKPQFKQKQVQTHDTFINNNQFSQSTQSDEKKSLILLKKQFESLRSSHKDLETQNKALKQQLQITMEMVNKKCAQLQKSKIDAEYSNAKKEQIIQSLYKKISQLKVASSPMQMWSNVTDPQFYHLAGSTKTGENEEQTIIQNLQNTLGEQFQSSRIRAVTKDKGRLDSGNLQKEFRLSKKQNGYLRKSLMVVLDALQDQNLIIQYSVENFHNDLRAGTLAEKISQISGELMKKVKQIKRGSDYSSSNQGKKLSFMSEPFSQIEPKHRKVSQFGVLDAWTQTDRRQTNADYIKQSKKRNPKATKSPETNKQYQNRLETLKKQLMKRVGMKKSVSNINVTSRKLLNQIEQNTHTNLKNISAGQWWKIKEIEQPKQLRKIQEFKDIRSPLKSQKQEYKEPIKHKQEAKKSIIAKKDISFQELKFQLKQNKTKSTQKRFLHQNNQLNRRPGLNRNSARLHREAQIHSQIHQYSGFANQSINAVGPAPVCVSQNSVQQEARKYRISVNNCHNVVYPDKAMIQSSRQWTNKTKNNQIFKQNQEQFNSKHQNTSGDQEGFNDFKEN